MIGASGMFAPLAGIRVLDLSHLLAGPYCTYLMALMGAEVVKIEPPEGDWTRGQGSDPALNGEGMGLTYQAQNAGKRSVSVNLKDPRGVALVKRLATSCQVFVENMRPGVIQRLGLGYGTIAEANPAIVYLSLSGFGQQGPLSHRPAYDHIIQGICGLMSINGHPGHDPVKVGAPFIDYASGLNAALAVVSALHEARRTGRGCHLDVAMLDSMLNLLTSLVVEYANAGTVPRRIGNDAPSGVATAGAFQASDGLLLIAANAETHFEPLARSIGLPGLPQDPRFATAAMRQQNREALRLAIGAAIRARPAAEWEAILDKAGVPATRPRTVPEIVDDPHVRARGIVQKVGSTGFTGLGWKVDGASVGPRTAPPKLGADTEAVLGELGISSEEIASLKADKVI
jgi:crotonobetainyl-CoA:carnitine CoA-transferase CaiB-like acyl-CoA transferase